MTLPAPSTTILASARCSLFCVTLAKTRYPLRRERSPELAVAPGRAWQRAGTELLEAPQNHHLKAAVEHQRIGQPRIRNGCLIHSAGAGRRTRSQQCRPRHSLRPGFDAVQVLAVEEQVARRFPGRCEDRAALDRLRAIVTGEAGSLGLGRFRPGRAANGHSCDPGPRTIPREHGRGRLPWSVCRSAPAGGRADRPDRMTPLRIFRLSKP